MEKELVLKSVTASEPYFHMYLTMETRIKEDGAVIATSEERIEILCGDWDKAEVYGVTSACQNAWTSDVLESWNNLNS